jgi:hypothetical protein
MPMNKQSRLVQFSIFKVKHTDEGRSQGCEAREQLFIGLCHGIQTVSSTTCELELIRFARFP